MDGLDAAMVIFKYMKKQALFGTMHGNLKNNQKQNQCLLYLAITKLRNYYRYAFLQRKTRDIHGLRVAQFA